MKFNRLLTTLAALSSLAGLSACGDDEPAELTLEDVVVSCGLGACLLEYNNDYDDTGECCFEVGGSNNCDLTTACPGGNCSSCLLYSTVNTSVGGSCCHYVDGSSLTSGAEEGCDLLLGAADTTAACF